MNAFFHISDSCLSFTSKATTSLLILTLSLFSAFLFKDIFLDPFYAGDESKYLSDLLKANEAGLRKVISDGTSITYLVITYYVNILIDAPLFSLKIVSLTSGILIFYLLYRFNNIYLKIDKPLKLPLFVWLAYLFIIQTTSFAGVNDILLDLFGTSLFLTFFIKKRISTKIVLFGLFLALSLATRKMAITYITSFFIVFQVFSIYSKNNKVFNFKNIFIALASFIVFFILLNTYPLLHNNKFSFDDKILKGEVNWAQWDYHNALLIDQGVQDRFTHVNIDKTKEYLQQNGKNSLPNTFLEMVYFDPLFTIKEFFVDALIGLKYIFRQTGMLVIAFIVFLIFRIRRFFLTKTLTNVDFIYVFSFFYFLLISFIVIANIQARWFMFFMPIMMLLIARDLNKLNKKQKLYFSISNNLLLSVMCFPYLIHKFSLYI